MDIEKIVNTLQNYDVEARMTRVETDSFYFEGITCKHPESNNKSLLIIRVTKHKKSGICSTTNPDKWRSCLKTAKKICDLSKPGQYYGIPEKTKYNEVKNFDKRVEKIGLEELKSMANNIINKSEARVVDAVVARSIGKDYFVNSNGIVFDSKSSLTSSSISVKERDSVAYEMHMSRKKEDHSWIGKKASDLCLKSVGKKQARTGIYKVFFDYFAASELFSILTNSFYANNIQEGNSMLRGKKGEQFFSKNLTIIDNGTLPYGLMTSKSDDEGTPKKKKTLVKNGVVNEFLYDYTTAKKEGRCSTGNFNTLMNRPSISETNVIIKPGKKTKEQILSDFDGIYVNQLVGTHTANPVSGDFSLNTENAFLLEKGEWKPIKHLMVAGNLFELLRKIEHIAKEPRQESSIMCSPIVVSDVQIIA